MGENIQVQAPQKCVAVSRVILRAVAPRSIAFQQSRDHIHCNGEQAQLVISSTRMNKIHWMNSKPRSHCLSVDHTKTNGPFESVMRLFFPLSNGIRLHYEVTINQSWKIWDHDKRKSGWAFHLPTTTRYNTLHGTMIGAHSLTSRVNCRNNPIQESSSLTWSRSTLLGIRSIHVKRRCRS